MNDENKKINETLSTIFKLGIYFHFDDIIIYDASKDPRATEEDNYILYKIDYNTYYLGEEIYGELELFISDMLELEFIYLNKDNYKLEKNKSYSPEKKNILWRTSPYDDYNKITIDYIYDSKFCWDEITIDIKDE